MFDNVQTNLFITREILRTKNWSANIFNDYYGSFLLLLYQYLISYFTFFRNPQFQQNFKIIHKSNAPFFS